MRLQDDAYKSARMHLLTPMTLPRTIRCATAPIFSFLSTLLALRSSAMRFSAARVSRARHGIVYTICAVARSRRFHASAYAPLMAVSGYFKMPGEMIRLKCAGRPAARRSAFKRSRIRRGAGQRRLRLLSAPFAGAVRPSHAAAPTYDAISPKGLLGLSRHAPPIACRQAIANRAMGRTCQ